MKNQLNRYTGYTIEGLLSKKPKGSRLTPIKFGEPQIYPSGAKRRMLDCLCDCGNSHLVDVTFFIKGKTKSCGCFNVEKGRSRGYSIEKINSLRPDGCRLTAIEFVSRKRFKGGQTTKKYRFVCVCGKEVIASQSAVISGNTKSCGCLMKKYTENRKPIQAARIAMLSRCYNKNNTEYAKYGAKGVRVCKEWRSKGGLDKFYDWSINNGWKPGLQIDKDIKGNGKLYSPKTCCWVTPMENTNHRSVTKRHKIFGKEFSIRDLCSIWGTSYYETYYHIGRYGVEVGISKMLKKGLISSKQITQLPNIK